MSGPVACPEQGLSATEPRLASSWTAIMLFQEPDLVFELPPETEYIIPLLLAVSYSP